MMIGKVMIRDRGEERGGEGWRGEEGKEWEQMGEREITLIILTASFANS